MIGCAAEQEAAWGDVLSIRGIGNVVRLVGQVWELMAETVCDVSLWARLFWSAQPVADTQGKRQDRLARLDPLTLSVFPPQSFHAYPKLRWLALFLAPKNLLRSCKTDYGAHITTIN